jgi:hypothetical protein
VIPLIRSNIKRGKKINPPRKLLQGYTTQHEREERELREQVYPIK